MHFYVYILANKPNGTLYVGMTDDLVRRVWQHRNGLMAGFTKRYGLKSLIWYEAYEARADAFMRERQMKKWNRAWKIDLIVANNPNWRDLWDEIAS